MRGIFVFVLSLGSFLAASQNLNYLEPKKISDNTNSTFVLVDKLDKDFSIVRKLSPFAAVVRSSELAGKYSYSEVYEINNQWKIADQKNHKKSKKFYIRTEKSLSSLKGLTEIYHDERRKISLIESNSRQIDRKILHLPFVTFVQSADRIPSEESILREHNLGINGIRSAQETLPGPGLSPIKVSIKEGAFDTLDLDINGRSELGNLSSTQVTSHATDMATLVAGKGNTSKEGTGVASHAYLLSESFNSLLPATTSYYQNRNLLIQNHSYGVGIENFYGIESVAFDKQAEEYPEFLHIFSSGNSGASNSTGDYQNITQYRTLTGSFKQAKNVLVVTGTDAQGDIPDAHSAGPAYDGRIKPELAAYGEGGTSDAAALVSGAAAVISGLYEQIKGFKPNGDLIKAMLISSSVDIGPEGPDFKSGFGQVNLRRALELVESEQMFSDGLEMALMEKTHSIQIPLGISEMRVALVWRDPPANNGDFIALVNDLNLRLEGDGQQWFPWVLDHRPDLASLEAPAVRRIDTLNNVEFISIKSPAPGEYDLIVSSDELIQNQPYSIAFFLEKAESFSWDYPTKEDPHLAEEGMQAYFTHSFDESGTMEIDYLNDSWLELGSIQPGEFTNSPSDLAAGEAVLRATFGLNEFKSDTFAIHEKLEMEVALFCEEELVLNWNSIDNIQSYELLMFQETALQPILSTTDTFAVLDRAEYEGLNFTVRPVFQYTKGRPDETVKVSQQGVGCYLNNFLVSIKENDRIQLDVDLSLPSRISALRIVRTDGNGALNLVDIDPEETLYSFSDQNLIPGKTTYQLILTTTGGQTINSDEISIFTTDDKKYILFPNPVTDGQLAFLSPVTSAVFQILDTSGRPLTDFIISAEFEVFSIDLSKGIYLYRVIKDGEVINSGRFAVGS